MFVCTYYLKIIFSKDKDAAVYSDGHTKKETHVNSTNSLWKVLFLDNEETTLLDDAFLTNCAIAFLWPILSTLLD